MKQSEENKNKEISFQNRASIQEWQLIWAPLLKMKCLYQKWTDVWWYVFAKKYINPKVFRMKSIYQIDTWQGIVVIIDYQNDLHLSK